MMLRSSPAAAFRSASAASTAAASRAPRQALRRSICSSSTVSGTVMMPASPSAASGEGSVSVQRLTPTTTCAPLSMAFRRSVLETTSCSFM